MSNDKKRPPDHFIQVVTQDSKGRDRHRDIGELWDGKEGYKTGDSIFGRIVIQSRDVREDLKKMRTEKQDQSRSQDHEHNQEM
jgi:hypothetical protein